MPHITAAEYMGRYLDNLSRFGTRDDTSQMLLVEHILAYLIPEPNLNACPVQKKR